MGPLRDIRVIDLSTGIAGGYATKLFADAGADVVKVEPPGGDPLRRWSASGAELGDDDGALFRFLAQSKRSVTGGLDDGHVEALVADADLVVESFEPGVIEGSGVLARHPALVVLSLSPWGHTGPYVDRPWTELILQAECGSIAGRGRLDGTPLQAGGRIAEWAAGVWGAPAALAAVRHARRTGRGAHVDVSLFEAITLCTNLFTDLMTRMNGGPLSPAPPRVPEVPSIEPTADGWVGFNTNSAQQFADFCVLIERPEWAGDERFRTAVGRILHADVWNEGVRAWTTSHTTAEIVELASLLRIPVAPIGHAGTLLDNEHLAARGMFAADPSGEFQHPVPPYKVDGVRPGPARPAPAAGADDGTVAPRGRPRHTPAAPDAAGTLPFDGLRVLDLTCWWAGPAASQFLAALGADCIHVESVQRPDGMRMASAHPFAQRDQWWEYGSFYLSINVNKRGLTLDLNDREGLELGFRLVEWADVVIENYTPRVLENFGLTWEAVHARNPRAVMVRMPAFGLDGPWRDRVGFAQTMEQLTGLAWITGYADGPPLIPRGPCDPIGAGHAAFALQAALARRDETGEGCLVEVPLVEGALNIAAEQVVEFTAYGHVLARMGNRSPGVAPQGVYACEGTERWLAVSVATDDQWSALRKALGEPGWSAAPELDAFAGRWAAHDDLDAGLAEWAAGQDAEDAAALLRTHGVPAAALTDPRFAGDHPHLAARATFEPCAHPVVGEHLMLTLPFRYSGVDRWIHSPAPTLGQHNAEILTGILGLDAADVERLAAADVIGSRPLYL